MSNPSFLLTSEHQSFDDKRLARITLMRCADPEDPTIQHLTENFGPCLPAALLRGSATLNDKHLKEAIAESITSDKDAFLESLQQKISRWGKRAAVATPEYEMDFASKIGAWVCIPEDPDWPAGVNDFGYSAPYALWGRGERGRLKSYKESRSVAVVGSRDISAYGTTATQHIAGDLATQGLTVISGGAFGIDAAAHQSALANGTSELPTIALMAGGIDTLYPKHNEILLKRVIDNGLIFSEVSLGQNPTRWRFLQRNRLIAGLARATVIVEARWRSGALNTAHHAMEIGRDVYAVPGSIFSPNSEGCHRLLSDNLATVLTNADQLVQNFVGTDTALQQTTAFELENQGHITDTLSEGEKIIWDALPVRRTMTIEELCSVTGHSAREVMKILGKLRHQELAVQDTDNLQWKKNNKRTQR
ncbi:DNA-processing protein DprA [Rothia terrae]|uniref:DNA-protecting protein DprA n=1 Tax=Rothia terrae TaxID=396015 RepID=A0A7H2BG49_9MICC|nr:DNA-processing protein DprA [Rothia terrae]QNV38645.1 DNA-protecting protein DprA [Rothia terrae]